MHERRAPARRGGGTGGRGPSLGRAFDEAGDVGEDELVLVEPHHAEVRHERGERVVGDLGFGRAHHRDQRRLARVREADERGVGEQLQLELAATAPRRTRPARRTKARGARSRGTARCRAHPGRPAPRASGRRRRRGRRAARRRARAPTVPSGTSMTRSAPAEPCFFLPEPCVPDLALRCGWSRNASNEATLRLARSQTSPPLPPSPPSGPPFGTCDSRRNATTPAPPSPALHVELGVVDEVGHRRKSTGTAVRSSA